MRKILLLSFIILFSQAGNLFAQVQLDASGSANNFIVTYPAVIQAVPSGGISFSFKSNQNITGSATLNLNGTGAKPIYKNFNQPLVSGDIKTGHFVQVIYDAANTAWQMQSVSAIPTPSGASAWTVSGSNIFNTNTSFVGINNTAPGYTLDIGGDINIKNDLFFGGFRSVILNPNGTTGNSFLGKNSGNITLTGGGNTLMGNGSANNLAAGSNNSFFGANSGLGNTGGSSNVFLGYQAGTSNSTGSNNVTIGPNANVSVGTLNNAIAIGANAVVTSSNMMVLGGTGGNAVSVGIGTGSPGNTIDVVGGARIRNLSATGVVFANSNGDLFISTSSGANAWTINGANIFPQTLSNNIGIGTSVPGQKLVVAGNTSIGGFITITGQLMAASANIANLAGPGLVATDPAGNLVINANPGVTAWTINGTNIFPQNLTQNIGIGTTVPGTKLGVAGAITVDASGINDGSAGLFPTSALRFGPSSGEGITSRRLAGANQNGLDFWTSTVNRMSITSAGNVGIGTATPNSKLHVIGNTTTTGTIMAQNVQIAGGTAGIPSYSFLNDLSTGMYLVNTNIIGFSTNGTLRMIIDGFGNIGLGTSSLSNRLEVNGNAAIGAYAGVNTAPANGLVVSGNVGIGTSAPIGILDINGGTNYSAFLRSTNGILRFASSANQNFIESGLTTVTGSAADLYFTDMNNQNQWMVIKTDGSVGIGTSSPNPDAILHINSSNSLTNGTDGVFLDIQNISNTTNALTGIRFTGSSISAYLKTAIFVPYTVGSYGISDMIFALNNGSNATQVSTADARMIIKSNGNVGIGVINPLSNLQIASTLSVGAQAVATGAYSMALGGNSVASGSYSLALGYNVTASGSGSFIIGGNPHNANGNAGVVILGDWNSNPITAATTNKMYTVFQNGYSFYSNAGLSTGVTIAASGTSWSTISDSSKKEKYEPVNTDLFLDKLKKMKIGSWNYKATSSQMRHYGPYAQEFDSYFGKDKWGRIGTDTTISTQDAEGVLFILSQGLEKRTADQKIRISQLEEKTKKQQEEIELLRKLLYVKEEDIKNIKTSFDKKYTSLESELEAIKKHLGLDLKSENK